MRFIYTKQFIIFSLLALLTAFFVFFEVKGWLSPVRTAFLYAPRPFVVAGQKVISPVKGFFSTVYQLNRISKENTELRQEIIRLKQDLVDFEKERKENEALRKELGFTKNVNYNLISCSVLSQNPFNLTESIVLNCGLKDGVEEGLAVVSQGYLIGKIVFVGSNTSTALLAVSSRFSTDAAISKTQQPAVVRGSFGSSLVLDQLSQEAQSEKGWLVVTAGIDQKIPRGVLIGEIGDEISSSSDLFKKITIASPVNFDSSEFVFVIKP